MEILFKLRAVSLDRDVAKAYVFEDEVFRKKFINKFKLLSDDVKQRQGSPQLDELLKSLKENIEAKEILERQTQWYAHKAGLSDYYNSAYSYFSGAVHANVRELQELVVVDDSGKIREILYGPDKATDLRKLLLTGGETQCLVFQDVNRVFSLKVEEKISELHARLKKLFGDA